jgi:diaminohydroxyphosphoribosylaminopyrimidine deaminase/5-amino-6-(5-phosphoribosylamino)uracil reductase
MDYTVAMQRAISLGEKGLGKTAPNPIVGAVIIDAAGLVIAEVFMIATNLASTLKLLQSKQQVKKHRVAQLL